jgi:hypothetical protein
MAETGDPKRCLLSLYSGRCEADLVKTSLRTLAWLKLYFDSFEAVTYAPWR